VHEAIGVLGAVSVATACVIPGSVAAQVARREPDDARQIVVEHPSGFFTVDVEVESVEPLVVRGAALLRTARKLLRGDVFVSGAIWSRA
jgi:4-oxalomesaconate tautomerase